MKLFPNAKINIGLYVTSKRPDGFHNIETFFYPLPDLCDRLEIRPLRKGDDFRFEASGIALDCNMEDNLIFKAYRLLAGDYDIAPVEVVLYKRIPFGAGLGGGSADAAFMLRGLNDMFELGLSTDRLCDYASRLGSDCSFFIRNTPAFAYGRGEMVEPADFSLRGFYVLIVKPSVSVSTAGAYKEIRPFPAPVDLRRLKEMRVDDFRDRLENVFEPLIVRRYPEVGEVRDRMYRMGALYASMSGSGPSVFGFFKAKPDTALFADYSFVHCGQCI